MVSLRTYSPLAMKLVREGLAARGHDGGQIFKGGGLLEGGASNPPLPSLEVAPAKLNEKVRGRAPAVQSSRLGQTREGDARARYVLAPVLVWSNIGERTHAAHEGVFPTRRVRSPVLVWSSDHAASAVGLSRARDAAVRR
jgi:hypothetical protein